MKPNHKYNRRGARNAAARPDNPFASTVDGFAVRYFSFKEGRTQAIRDTVGIHALFGLRSQDYRMVTVIVGPKEYSAWSALFSAHRIRVISTTTARKNKSWKGLVLCVEPEDEEDREDLGLFVRGLGVSEIQLVEIPC